MSGLVKSLARKFSIIVFTLFILYLFFLLLNGGANCGCYGKVGVAIWKSLLVDVFFLIALLRSRPIESRQFPLRTSIFYQSCGVVISCGVAAWMGLFGDNLNPQSHVSTTRPTKLLVTATWTGQHIQTIPFLNCDKSLHNGKRVLVIIRADCSSCAEVHLEFLALKNRKDDYHYIHDVSFLELPSFSPDSSSPLVHSAVQAQCTLTDQFAWVANTPIIVEFVDGVVVRAFDRAKPGSSEFFRVSR